MEKLAFKFFLSEIDPNERIVTIEDAQELYIENENKTQLAVPKKKVKSIPIKRR